MSLHFSRKVTFLFLCYGATNTRTTWLGKIQYFTNIKYELSSHYHYLTFVLSLFTRQLSINDWNVQQFRRRWWYWLTSLLIGQYDRPWCWLVALVSPVRSSVLRLCHWTTLADFESRKNELVFKKTVKTIKSTRYNFVLTWHRQMTHVFMNTTRKRWNAKNINNIHF